MRIIYVGSNGRRVDMPYDGVYLERRLERNYEGYFYYNVFAYSVANPSEKVATLLRDVGIARADELMQDIASAYEEGRPTYRIYDKD